MAMYCERIRRRFWPEWFVDLEDFRYDDDDDESKSCAPTSKLPDLGLYSCTETFQDDTGSRSAHSAGTPPMSPGSDPTGISLYDSDMDTECSEMEPLKC